MNHLFLVVHQLVIKFDSPGFKCRVALLVKDFHAFGEFFNVGGRSLIIEDFLFECSDLDLFLVLFKLLNTNFLFMVANDMVSMYVNSNLYRGLTHLFEFFHSVLLSVSNVHGRSEARPYTSFLGKRASNPRQID